MGTARKRSEAMRTSNLSRNQLSPEAFGWYLGYLQAMDSLDIEACGGFLADGCRLQMNNDAPIAAGRPPWTASRPIGGASRRWSTTC